MIKCAKLLNDAKKLFFVAVENAKVLKLIKCEQQANLINPS